MIDEIFEKLNTFKPDFYIKEILSDIYCSYMNMYSLLLLLFLQ